MAEAVRLVQSPKARWSSHAGRICTESKGHEGRHSRTRESSLRGLFCILILRLLYRGRPRELGQHAVLHGRRGLWKAQTETLVKRVNGGEAENKGVELEIEQQFEGLRRFANFIYTESEVTENDSDPSLMGKELVQVPRKLFNIGEDYRYGPFTTSIIGRYVSKRYRYDDNRDEAEGVFTANDPYFVTDARIAHKITSFADFSLFVDNIFNENYYSSYKALERSWFAKLSFTY